MLQEAFDMICKSKKDLWLVGAITASVVVTAFAGGYLLIVGPGTLERRIGFALLVTGIIPLLLCVPVHYLIEHGVLHVRSGFLRWTIPLRDILEVHRTPDPIASPALSLDRLRIIYTRQNGKVICSFLPTRAKHSYMN